MKLLKRAKRVFSAVAVLTASLAQLTSCDSREYWFAKEGEGATFIIKSSKFANIDDEDEESYDFRNDTVCSDNPKVVEFNLKLCDVSWMETYYESRVNYYSEQLNLDIEGLIQKVYRKAQTKMSVTTSYSQAPEFVSFVEKNWVYFLGREGGFPITRNDTTAPVLNTADVIIALEDAFQNEFYCHVKVNCLGDITPIPVMEIKDVEGYPMEKVLSLSNSYDKDGSVSKYEYCIDGNIRSYNLPKYDCDPEGFPAGKGAYGGTYITATEKSEVKHAFQTEGEHIVYYRCMDNLGLWSVWNSVTVTIK